MRLVRYLYRGEPAPGAVVSDRVVPLAMVAPEYTSITQLAAAGPAEVARLTALVARSNGGVALSDIRLLAPIERPGMYLGIGMNYENHAKEAEKLGVPRPTRQLWFNKQTVCISGPFDDIDPGVTEKLDYEVELGVVIGRAAKGLTKAQARDHVFGYFVANDVSARDWQFHSPTFTIGKSFDTYGPIGPWIVTADEIDDPHKLGLRCFVNGEKRQDSNTSQLIYNIWQQIAYLSTAFTLQPGDLLATGTPEGVGIGMKPPTFLKSGDVVRCEIDQIGAIENKVAPVFRRPTTPGS
jgi:2-keto-4-pentenoate hydratase/2-oxohepta-3-ene-1,7-dioic acid hydratase in catechol pathway